jgi:hypothetical protein
MLKLKENSVHRAVPSSSLPPAADSLRWNEIHPTLFISVQQI